MARIKFELTFDTDNGTFSVVNTETGEIQEVAMPKTKKSTTKKAASKKEDDGDPIPKITLDENKYTLNTAASDLLLNPGEDNRLEIKFMKQGKTILPTISNSGSGNKVTKSLTVSCRGKAHDELSEYGTVFTLKAYPGKSGVYLLCGDNANSPLEGDDNISIPDEDEVLNDAISVDDDDLDLSDFDTEDVKEEVEASDFINEL